LEEIVISTRRLLLVKLRVDDAERVYRYRSLPEVNKYQSFHPNNIHEVTQFITENTISINEDNSWYQLGVYLSSGDLIGDLGIHFISKDQGICEIGYTINPSYQNQGYGKEAVIGVIKYLFDLLEKRVIIASIDNGNIASHKLVETIGFKVKNKTKDYIEYQLTKSEYLSK
jgi:RimJ/RimL family protein N-acetyltransferase